MKLILKLNKKALMNKFLFFLSTFSLATISLTSQSFAALTQPEKEMFVFGVLTAVCEMHHENNLSDSIAKIYTKQYFYHANNMLSKSEVEDIKIAVLGNYPSCPLSK